MIFVPHHFGGHDYAAMLERVTAAMSPAPEVVVLRGESGSHTAYPALLGHRAGCRAAHRRWIPTPCGWSSTRPAPLGARKAFCTLIIRYTR